MPEPIQTAEQSTRLASLFKLKGRLPMSLDEIIVPVVIVGNTDEADVPPPAFGAPPGPDKAQRGFWLPADAVNVTGLRITAGNTPAELTRIALYGQTSFWGIFPGNAGPSSGAIGIVSGDWAARRPGNPSLTVERHAFVPFADINEQPLVIIPTPNVGTVGWFELGIALQASGEAGLSTVTLIPCRGSAAPASPTGFETYDGTQDHWCSLEWRE